MTNIFDRIVNNSNKDSYSAILRRRRFKLFHNLIQNFSRPVSILDVGGVQRFWEIMGFVSENDVNVTILNLTEPQTQYPNFTGVVGDATNLVEYEDKQFDVVFSNSVIEHVGGFKQQNQMAMEVRRVGKCYFVQTPNYYFPVEPHFLFPGFQWLPISARTFMITHWNLGWHKRISDSEDARVFVEQIRLLRKNELLALFPDGNLYEERVVGLTKSFVIYGGFSSSVSAS